MIMIPPPAPSRVRVSPAAELRQPETAAPARRQPAASRTGKTKVYVVEEHGLTRRNLATVIGVETDMELCGTAAHGAAAIGDISELRPDVVIVDLSLPGINGIEVIRWVRTFDATIRFVALSSPDETVYAMRALQAGARGCVTTQDNGARVVEAIRHVLRGRMFVSDLIAREMLDLRGGDPGQPGQPPGAGLSDREFEIATLLGSGLSAREIAAHLCLTVKTVEAHRAQIMTKLA